MALEVKELINSESEIKENYADNNGGTIYIGNDLFGGSGGGLVIFRDSQISNNSARNFGGSVFNFSGH